MDSYCCCFSRMTTRFPFSVSEVPPHKEKKFFFICKRETFVSLRAGDNKGLDYFLSSPLGFDEFSFHLFFLPNLILRVAYGKWGWFLLGL